MPPSSFSTRNPMMLAGIIPRRRLWRLIRRNFCGSCATTMTTTTMIMTTTTMTMTTTMTTTTTRTIKGQGFPFVFQKGMHPAMMMHGVLGNQKFCFSSTKRRQDHDGSHSAILQMPQRFPEMEFDNNPYELDRHGHGESYHPSKPPTLIVYPKSTQDVQKVMQYCLCHDIAMIPFGAGTSVEGHVTAIRPNNTLSIDLSKYMTTIHEIPDSALTNRHVDAYAVVDAGVTRLQLQAALKHTGFYFSVDPGADATLGGMVATGASGTTTVRHGTMKDNVLELSAVLATTPEAPVIHTGCKALKNSAGYDLTSLLVGSEGTLGVITRITVKLHPVPQYSVAITCAFDTLEVAAQAVSTCFLYDGLQIQRCELLDATSIKIFQEAKRKSSSDNDKSNNKDASASNYKPTLFLELSGVTESALQEQVRVVVRDVLGYADDDTTLDDRIHLAYQEQDRLELWKARHGLYYAAIASRPGAQKGFTTDACVPRSHLADLLLATAKDVEELAVIGPCFGHAGDGNFHCILPILNSDQESPEYVQKIKIIQNNLIRRTLAVGGTCTGEHGIGTGKRNYLKQQYDKATIQTMKLIKRALDPQNLMNPGKILTLDDDDDDDDDDHDDADGYDL